MANYLPSGIAACMAQKTMPGLCFCAQRPLDAQPSSRGGRSEILLRPISVCLCARVCVCVRECGASVCLRSPCTWNVNVCAYVRGWAVGTGSRESSHPGNGRKALGWRAGQKLCAELQASNIAPPHRPLQPRRRLQLRRRRRMLEHRHYTALHGTAEHVLIHVRDPTWPNAVHHAIHQTCLGHHRPPTKSLETRLLLALRGAALAIRGLLWIAHP